MRSSLDRFHLLGTSMGGMIAQEYAIAHADRLRSVALCNTYAWPGPYCLRMFQLWRELVPHLGVGFTQREILLWAFTPEFVETRPEECAEVEAELAANPQAGDAVPGAAVSRSRRTTRAAASRAVTCPALTLVGRAGPDHLPGALPAACTRSCRAPPGSRCPAATRACGSCPDAFNARPCWAGIQEGG